MRLLHNAVDFSLPCFPVYPIRGLTGILYYNDTISEFTCAFSALGIV